MLTDLVLRLLGRRRSVRKRTHALSSPAESLEDRALLAVTFKFDYRFDTGNFFDTGAKKNALNLAGNLLTSRLNDTLDAISPSGDNTWTATFTNPGNGRPTTLTDLSIAANEILIFPGGRDLQGGLGRGGWGGYNWQGNSEWGKTVGFRGEADNGTDFGPWGGTLAFNSTRDWHFGSTIEGLDDGEFDFVSVAVHELGHALGFAGGNVAYDRFVSGGTFSGPRATAEYDGSGNVPLSSDGAHWANNTTDNGQRTLLDPSINDGLRELPTFLDWGGIDDIGWEVNQAANDFGDAPSNRYPTLSSQNGARHNTKAGLFLGVWGDGESNGQASDDADGFDDEDGVRILDTLYSGDTARIDLTANRESVINAWMDFNLDGDWDDAGEQILTDVSLEPGQNRVTIDVPDNARSGISYARFRLNSNGGLSPVGAASDGEVEDYEIRIVDGVLAIDDSAQVSGITNINVLSNDILSSRAEVLSVTQPGKGSTSINTDGTIRFDPEGEGGTTAFDYTIGLEQLRIEGSAANDQLGRATVIDGDTLVVAASTATTNAGSGTGEVRVYRRDGLDWDLFQTITANDEEQGDRFGFSVDISGDTLVVGSRGDDDDGRNSGSAYVFKRDSESSRFSFTQKLLASDGRAKDQFGHSVSIDGNVIAVGVRLDDNGGSGSGSVEVFQRSDTSSDFAFTQRL
ncbi:MAG: GEVED domain-containing protein, partial [Planctomycetaceae bacterium]